MIALPSCEALEVERDGVELLVPLVRDAIRSIDLEARRIDIDLGFLGSMSIDVFTLFPQWFEWFRAQRHVRERAGARPRARDRRLPRPRRR